MQSKRIGTQLLHNLNDIAFNFNVSESVCLCTRCVRGYRFVYVHGRARHCMCVKASNRLSQPKYTTGTERKWGSRASKACCTTATQIPLAIYWLNCSRSERRSVWQTKTTLTWSLIFYCFNNDSCRLICWINCVCICWCIKSNAISPNCMYIVLVTSLAFDTFSAQLNTQCMLARVFVYRARTTNYI